MRGGLLSGDEVMKKGGVCRGEAACSRLGAAGKIA